MGRRRLIVGGALAALAVVLLMVLLIPKGGAPDRAVEAVAPADTPQPTAAPLPLAEEAEPQVESQPEAPADTPVPAPTPDPGLSEEAARRALTRPTPTAEGFIPVFSQAETDEKIIAITVDDCFQAENLRQIVDKAIECGAKLTIFPIGKNVIRSQQKQILKYAWENGMELENHTMTHNGLYNSSEQELTQEIYMQQMSLSYILGVEYQCHFLRPKGGDARKDQRLQMYAKQLGYYGIAHWNVSGTAGKTAIAKGLQPGSIYLFHTTDKDLEKLLAFIPWAKEQGYQLVTLNEMFGYPANETSALTIPIEQHVIPPLEPYEMVYVPLKETTYCWEAYLLQQKLIELGYLDGEPDGVYGPGCAKAVAKYQQDHGMAANGVADADLVRSLLEGGASSAPGSPQAAGDAEPAEDQDAAAAEGESL